jgi:hypothetical protein
MEFLATFLTCFWAMRSVWVMVALCVAGAFIYAYATRPIPVVVVDRPYDWKRDGL